MFKLKLYIVIALVISKENLVLNADNPTANVFDSFDDTNENNEPEATVPDASEEHTTSSAVLDTESTLEDDSIKTGDDAQELPNVIENEPEANVPENIEENTSKSEMHNTESTLEDNGNENNDSIESLDEERLHTVEEGVNPDIEKNTNADKSDEDTNDVNLENNDSSEITTKVNTVEDKLVDYDDDKTLEEVDLSEKETSADKDVTDSFDETKTDNHSTDSFDNSEQATENEDIEDDHQQTNDLHAIDLVNQDSSEDNNNMILLTNDIKSEDFKIDDSNQDLTLDGPIIGSKSITSVYICSFLKFHL